MNILVGYDGSNAAKDALKLAKNNAKAFDAKIIVVKSVTSHQPLDPGIFKAADEKLEWEIQNQINGDMIRYETRLLVSSRSSGENLVWFAEQLNISKIIIGVRKRSKVGKLLLGSTAQYVILHAPCPVVSIK
jgi:nucleotide-binding universal stress UspA family protein